jgi:hypothetical protein
VIAAPANKLHALLPPCDLKRLALPNRLIKTFAEQQCEVLTKRTAAIAKVARKKTPLPRVSRALSTAPCEQAVYNFRLTTVAPAKSNCLKHERSKIKIFATDLASF